MQLLRSVPLRTFANDLSYFDKSFATRDAMLIGRLHTWLPGWLDANVAFMQSGGYAVSKLISAISQETLIVWGRNDIVLDPKNAELFMKEIPHAKLVWIEECSHFPHIEKPEELAQVLLDFICVSNPATTN